MNPIILFCCSMILLYCSIVFIYLKLQKNPKKQKQQIKTTYNQNGNSQNNSLKSCYQIPHINNKKSKKLSNSFKYNNPIQEEFQKNDMHFSKVHISKPPDDFNNNLNYQSKSGFQSPYSKVLSSHYSKISENGINQSRPYTEKLQNAKGRFLLFYKH